MPLATTRSRKRSSRTTAGLTAEIRILISIIAKLNLRAMEQRLSEILPGMSVLQYGLLRRLADEPCTLSELSNRMLLTPSTLVPAIDKLEREGYLVRGKDPNDRRRAPLSVTEAGRRVLDMLPGIQNDDAFIRSVEALGPAQAERLRALLHALLLGIAGDPALVETLLANHPQRECAG